MLHILIVEDDREIAQLIAQYLGTHDMHASIAANGQDMDFKLRHNSIDLIVLDLGLPKEDGLSICLRLRQISNIPIIMLTAKGEDIDRIIGLEMGADDYLPKPFNPRELVARIRAVLRRPSHEGTVKGKRSFAFSGWHVDCGLRQVLNPQGAKVALTSAEFDLLTTFCEYPGRVLSRKHLLEITQSRMSESLERSVDILVSRLRQKIETNPRAPEMIKTVRSGGYLFTQIVEAE